MSTFSGALGYGYSHMLHGITDRTPAQEVQNTLLFSLPGLDVSIRVMMKNIADKCIGLESLLEASIN